MISLLLMFAIPAQAQVETILEAPATAEIGSWYALAVSISDQAAIVGAGREDGEGAVYIFEKIDGVWTQVQRVASLDIDRGDDFGGKLSLDGTRAVIGARYDDSNAGSAYVFDRQPDGAWIETARLVSSDRETGDNLGEFTAVDGDRIVVGARREDTGGNDAGAAYVFELLNGVWTETAKLQSSDIGEGDRFGQTVSVDGDRIVAGGGGAVYVFDLQNGVWTETARLTSSVEDGQFGLTVDHKGDRIAVSGQGAAYVFELQNGVWIETARPTPTSGTGAQVFGRRVSLSGDRLLVSAHLSTVNGLESAGSAFLYELQNGTWVQIDEITASDAKEFDKFGSAINISGDRVIIGAPGLSFTATETGAAYIYEYGDVNANPTASFTFVATDLSVDFNGSGSTDDGTIVNWDWDFGDGAAGAGALVSHTFAAAGTYTVMLTVTDDAGATGSVSQEVSVGDLNLPPVASFTAVQVTGTLEVSFDGTGSTDDGAIVSWDWDFGDGNTGIGSTASNIYATAGSYTVTLIVTDDAGATGETSQSVTVDPVVTGESMHVDNITTITVRTGGSGNVEATVTILDQNGLPVEGASVSGTFSDDVTGTDTQSTDINGEAILVSDAISSRPGVIGICIDEVTHATLTYDPAANTDPTFACTAPPAAHLVRGVADENIGDNGLPVAFALNGNYPNPFNPSTVIPFEVSEPSDVQLEVYDLMGRRIATLVNGHLEAGRYEATWDATSDATSDSGAVLANGVYLYRLRAGSFEAVRRMVFMK